MREHLGFGRQPVTPDPPGGPGYYPPQDDFGPADFVLGLLGLHISFIPLVRISALLLALRRTLRRRALLGPAAVRLPAWRLFDDRTGSVERTLDSLDSRCR